MPPKITVYIPSHNYGQYIQKSIESVLKQKFHDWELILINDGSTDNTRHILSSFQGHPKVQVIHQEKKGLTVSNNIALRMAQGEYIMRLDADDFLDENALLVLSNTLDLHPEAGLAYPDYYRIDENDQIIDLQRREKIDSELKLLDMPAHGACTMIRKSCLMELGGYNEAFSCQDGYDLWIRFIQRFKPYNVNIPLFYYRQHPASLTKDTKRILETRHQVKRNFVRNTFGTSLPKVLAIIPIRTEKDRVHLGALQKCGGKYLIDYSLEESLKTPLLDKVVLTSNDEDILGHATKYPKIEILKRPSSLALFNSEINSTIEFVLDRLDKEQGYSPDAVMILYPLSPLRRFQHIEQAIDTMLIFNVDSVVSVCEDLNVYYQHSKEGLKLLQKERLLRLEREALYRENGAIYLSKISVIKRKRLLGSILGHIVMLPEESIKVDSPFHLWLVDKVLKEWRKE